MKFNTSFHDIPTLAIPYRKEIRTKVIKRYMTMAGLDACICFSCGNASRALKDAGIETVAISNDDGDLRPSGKWWNMREIRRVWPHLFDATPGHLPMDVMWEISMEYRKLIHITEKMLKVTSGSGETIVCLSMAFPEVRFIPVYNCGKGTEYSDNAPLNPLVKALCAGAEYAFDQTSRT